MKHGEPAPRRGDRSVERDVVKARTERDRPDRGEWRGGRTRGQHPRGARW